MMWASACSLYSSYRLYVLNLASPVFKRQSSWNKLYGSASCLTGNIPEVFVIQASFYDVNRLLFSIARGVNRPNNHHVYQNSTFSSIRVSYNSNSIIFIQLISGFTFGLPKLFKQHLDRLFPIWWLLSLFWTTFVKVGTKTDFFELSTWPGFCV